MADKKISQLTELAQVNVDVDADYLAIVDSSATETKKVLVDAAVLATLSQSSVPSINGTTIPTSKTLVVTTDIGTTVQAYDADTAKYDDTTANFTGTLQNGGSNVVVDSDIGSTVQAYDANTAKYDDTTANFTGTLQNGGHTVLTNASDYLDSADIGVNVLAYDSNLQAFVTTFALPEADGSANQVLKTDGAGNIGFATVSTSAAGSDTQIQYNSSGAFAGASGLTTDGSNLTIGAQGDLRLADADSSNYVALQAPATVATNVTFTLPDADGTSGQALTTDGSGALSWATVAGSPGGSDTQLQYNSSGSFAGASGLITDGSNLTINAQGDLRFADSDSSNWVAFQAPATIASNVTWTLPDADGTSGQVLSTDGSGALSWATASGGGGGGGTSSTTVTQYTATASQTTFSVTYTVGQLSVYLNGALLSSSDYTASNGTSVVLASGAASGDIFTAVAYLPVSGLEIDSASPYLTAVGSGAGAVNTGVNNTFVGFESGNDNSTGTDNTAVGYRALDANTTGLGNTALGVDALGLNATANNNTAVGWIALRDNTTGAGNTALGRSALQKNTTASNNTAVGFLALLDNTTGASNTAVGYAALTANTTGANNVAVGYQTLDACTTGALNTAVGNYALSSLSTGNANVAFGAYSLNNCTSTTVANTALGYAALFNLTTGTNNIGVGLHGGRTGGDPAGIFNVTTESNRIVVGNDAHTNAYIKIAWTVTSDARDKTNIESVPHGLSFVNQLNPVSYQFRKNRESDTPSGNKRYGFLAQDILALEGDDPVIIDNEQPDHLKYQGEALVPVLVNAIKELSAKCDSLQAEINTLKGQ